jgi:8-oxo-dGTP pyrophosphatase MutT (NUDIX family)
LNPGDTTPAREAACLILLRDTAEGAEVLLVQRNPEQRFMGGAWVFPGGAVHAEDGDHLATAARELEEEAGIRLDDPSAAVAFARWITPSEVKVRFDTWFFVARAPEGVEAKAGGQECVGARWIRPADALAAGERDELMLVFPTVKQLERLARSGSVEEVLDEARSQEVRPVQPRVVLREGSAHVVLPGEPGYDD